jgi:hypothetical protein
MIHPSIPSRSYFLHLRLPCHAHFIDPQQLNDPPVDQPALCLEVFFTPEFEAELTLAFELFFAPDNDDGLLLGLELFLTPDPDAILEEDAPVCGSVINTPLLSNFGSAEKAPTPM